MTLHQKSAKELHQLFMEGKASAKEIVDAHYAQIEKKDGEIGAFLSLSKKLAYEQAERLDQKRKNGEKLGALAGVPIAIKDNIHVKGEPSTAASKILAGYVAPFAATACERLEAAGAIFLGKTNMDEFGMGSSTENSGLQKTRNPWDLNAVPGGSSGGSAAAVAARMVPIALGSDTGGSVRQPASFCGILGLKPTYGKVSRYGLIAYGSSLDTIGTFARNVEDLQLAMEVMSGPCDHDSTSLPERGDSFLLAPLSLKGLKIGVPSRFLADLNPEAKSLFQKNIDALVAEGAQIVDVDLDLLKYALPVYYILATAEASTNLARYDGIRFGHRSKNAKGLKEVYNLSREEGFGAEVKRRILLGTFVLSSGFQEAYYQKAQKVRTRLLQMYAKAFSACDFIATPTSPFSAFQIGSVQDPVQMYLEDLYTIGINLGGLPAINLPTSMTSAGKPMGLQLIAPFGQDSALLRASAALEQVSFFTSRDPYNA